MKRIKTLIIYFIVLLTSIITASGNKSSKIDSTASYMRNSVYPLQIELYEIYKKIPADIVMLGDSRTAGANWNELLGRPNVVQRGIPSDITEGYLARMEYVYNLQPKFCFIQGGLNDIYNWTPVEKIYQNFIKIISGLRAKGIKPVIQSTVYAGKIWGKDYLMQTNSKLKAEEVNKDRNEEIAKLNKMLQSYAKRNNIIFIDLNEGLTERGFLKDNLTRDGVHYNARGYKIWARKVDEVLTELGY